MSHLKSSFIAVLVPFSSMAALVGCYTKDKNPGDVMMKIATTVCVNGNGGSNCGGNDATEQNLVQLRADSTKILTDNCSSCHANGNRQGGFGDVLNSEVLLKPGSKYVNVGSPESSLLFTRMTNANQPMPPKGVLSKENIETIRAWISAEGKGTEAARERVKMVDVFKTVRDDFDRQQNRKDLRYIHFVNLWNSGVSEAEIQKHREGLSKLLNMLSTRNKIEKPVTIDGKALIYRIDLSEYDLQTPFGLNPPDNPAVRIGRWKEVFESRRPARDTAAEDAFFVANFQTLPPEYKTQMLCD
ncbi:hypothetical protein EBR21_16500, partial [bacterium]|nr:hypothetical protein [bacterium]